MPLEDKTGPYGQGPRSGRGFGRCGGYKTEGRRTQGKGQGVGRGAGFFAPCDSVAEKDWLTSAIEATRNRLQALEKRQNELKAE